MLNIQVIKHLINPGNTNITPGISNVTKALNLLNKPQHQYKVIHITGTNGKGSTAAFIEAGLLAAGYRVGKYTSPYIKQINETISLNLVPISNQELEQCFFAIDKLIKDKVNLSPFEYLTVIMFYYFAGKSIDYLVLEVGMGGANDATNVVNSKFSIITNISLEHTQWLGNSLEEIAQQKAGIIKNGKTIIADNLVQLINAVKAKTTNYTNVLTKYLPEVTLNKFNFTTQVKFLNQQYDLSLFGKFQANNFLCAYEVLTSLNVPLASIHYAASHTKWPGRLEVIAKNPLTILDATHNEAGAKSLAETLNGLYLPQQVVIITSILADKNILAMLNYFRQLATSIIYTGITNNPRGLSASQMAHLGTDLFPVSFTVNDPLAALNQAQSLNKSLIIITGSLYLLSYYINWQIPQ